MNILQENKISVVIKRSVRDVFEFTTNPKNTPLWILSIKEEVADPYPPKIGSQYKNHSGDLNWDIYKVIAFERNKIFTLSDLEDNYHVQYSYRSLDPDTTEMEYFEWVNEGDISNPFTKKVLEQLKFVMERM